MPIYLSIDRLLVKKCSGSNPGLDSDVLSNSESAKTEGSDLFNHRVQKIRVESIEHT